MAELRSRRLIVKEIIKINESLLKDYGNRVHQQIFRTQVIFVIKYEVTSNSNSNIRPIQLWNQITLLQNEISCLWQASSESRTIDC